MKTSEEIWEDKEKLERVMKAANEEFYWELAELYCPDIHVLPLTPEGEANKDMLYNKYEIGRYGAYESNFEFEGEIYLVILVNND